MAGKRGNGEGSIYQIADGRWRGALTDLGGRRRVLSGRTRAEVASQLAAAIRDRDKGLPMPAEKETVAGYMARWLKVIESTVRAGTWQRYECLVRLHLVPKLGKIGLGKLTPAQIQSLYGEMLAAGLAPATVVHLHAVLRRALSQAEQWGLLARNAAALVDRPRIPRRETSTLNPVQARALLDAARGRRDEALYVVALSTGMRQGELLALRWHDVDLESGNLRVTATIRRTPQGVTFSEPKTSRSRRQVSLTPISVEALRSHRARQLAERLKASAWEDNDLVFPNEVGRPMEAQNLMRRSFLPLLERAQLPRIRFHDLRHTAATLLLGRGTHPKLVSEMLGHSQIAITLDLYSHTSPNMHREAAAVMDSILRG